MAKYIDADILRKEIEFAKSVYSNPNRVVHGVADAFRQDGLVAMCNDIIEKIDSLQQEKPEVDLERIIEQTYHDGSVADTDDMDHVTYENIARHFYELGQKDAANKYDEIEYNRQRAEEEMLGKTLDEAAENYTDSSEWLPGENLEHLNAAFKAGAKWQEEKNQEIIKLAEDHAFLAGADWQKEQMMKGAEKEVVKYHYYPEYKYVLVPYEEFNVGDKVRIIIVKEG